MHIPTLSIIIPALNEHDGLPNTVAHTRACCPHAEIIVADGGSTDGTAEWAQASSDVRLVTGARGRGPQMNAGAGVAAGTALLFLHADCLLPPLAEELVARVLSNADIAGGAFRLRFSSTAPAALHRLALLINLRSQVVREASGDQAIFVRREVFDAAQGFPDWPLFEDFALVARLKQCGGRFCIVRGWVSISPRRWLTYGIGRTSLLMCALYVGYRAGVPPAVLKRWFADVRPHT